jgi:hypothetical protein
MNTALARRHHIGADRSRAPTVSSHEGSGPALRTTASARQWAGTGRSNISLQKRRHLGDAVLFR